MHSFCAVLKQYILQGFLNNGRAHIELVFGFIVLYIYVINTETICMDIKIL